MQYETIKTNKKKYAKNTGIGARFTTLFGIKWHLVYFF